MNKTIVIFSLLFLISACGESKNDSSASTEKTVAHEILELNDGAKLKYKGKLLYSVERENENGTARVNKITVNSGSKIVENSIFAQLSELGYTRKVMDSTGDTFKVHYYKKGQPTIGSYYQEKDTQGDLATNISMYWKIK